MTSIEAQGFGKLGAVFASGARKQVGASDTVDNVLDFDERVARIGVGLAKVAGELGAKMTGEARREA
jgi:hypothetical protein